jgi:hypothetical protein
MNIRTNYDTYNIRFLKTLLFAFVFSLFPEASQAQERQDVIVLNRGRLWHSFHYGQECEPLSDWQRNSYGLDWPGFNPGSQFVPNIGGSNSHIVSGGLFITSLNDTGAVQGWDNFATNGKDRKGWFVQGESNDYYRYLVLKHEKRWPDGENFWLAADPDEAEEVIDTNIEINGAWYEPWDNQPIRVGINRTVRQWSGSQSDEDYVIIDYTIRNIQRRENLKGLYLLFTYALSPNNRGWRLTSPNLPEGARNTQSTFDEEERLLIAWAGDNPETPVTDESFDYYENTRFDPIQDQTVREPEFLAPGFLGIKFLYIAPDSTGRENHINGFAWSAAAPSQDHSGPFLGVTGLDNKYNAMADPLLLSEAFDNPDDPRMGSSRLYANFSLGPFEIPRRDSIKVVIAEFVGGLSYEKVIDPATTREQIRAAGDSAMQYLSNRVQFNYEHDYRVPMPPPSPDFTVASIDSGSVLGNTITFDNSSEMVNDPHQGFPDIAGYRIYRSWNLPFGPWERIADIAVGDPAFYEETQGLYNFNDLGVALGYDYYYAVTAYDDGHDSWTVDNSVRVPPLESSIFASSVSRPFSTTLESTERTINNIAVVPNPFYRHSGLPKLGTENRIQFVNLSERCTIRIYTIRGDLVKRIDHDNPDSGVAYWNQISDNGQLVKSGMYFYHVENAFGDVKQGKFAIIK